MRSLAEAVGAALGWLADAGAVAVPEVLADPARLHGDLWAGNREFDLAMMRLFGGFGEDCFAAWS